MEKYIIQKEHTNEILISNRQQLIFLLSKISLSNFIFLLYDMNKYIPKTKKRLKNTVIKHIKDIIT